MADAVVGREPELAALRGFLADGAPLPAALVLEGDAGIGKTTLWRAAIEIAGEAGHRVLRCQAAVAESQLAFAALSDLLAGALDDTLPGLPLPQRRALEIALLLVEPAGAPPDIRALAAACLGVIRQLTAHSSVVVAIDDVQWLDASSRTVLEFAVRRLTGEPVAVLVATRGIGQEPPLGLERTLPADRLLRVPVTASAWARRTAYCTPASAPRFPGRFSAASTPSPAATRSTRSSSDGRSSGTERTARR